MANICELLINTVIKNKLKLLTGLDQKVSGQDIPVLEGDMLTLAPSVERQSLTRACYVCGTR